ncbi:MAG: hypothetical protein IT324_03480 [Anaerolineae bacterium]|nr:hypothetical protein [Anaerolineae bacterium]
MRRPFPPFFLILIGVSLLVLAGLLTLSPQVSPVDAQCGTSASSCKNCHEVNAKHPVNASGEWHVSHAFGDFCSFCHAGNVQATDEKEAHEGMIGPLSDPKGSCAACHADDYEKKAAVYATALGAKINPDGGKPAGGSGSGEVESEQVKANASIESKPIDPPGEKYASGPLIDYNRRYDMEVLGKTDGSPVGNFILAVMAVGLTVFGAALVWYFERGGGAQRNKALKESKS